MESDETCKKALRVQVSMREYVLIRSKRKSLALHIRGGALEVRAPLIMPKKEIDKFVASKEKWIAGKLASSEKHAKSRKDFRLDYGSTVLYLGNEYPIEAKSGNRVGFDKSFFMPPGLSADEIKSACVQIYRLLAKRELTSRALHFSKQLNVAPSAVKINNAKTRWGSCSTRKSLNFSWRLVMSESDVVDYVVVHELAHLIEMNHSDKFWAIVESVLPDYPMRKKRLKELTRRLAGEDWEVHASS